MLLFILIFHRGTTQANDQHTKGADDTQRQVNPLVFFQKGA